MCRLLGGGVSSPDGVARYVIGPDRSVELEGRTAGVDDGPQRFGVLEAAPLEARPSRVPRARGERIGLVVAPVAHAMTQRVVEDVAGDRPDRAPVGAELGEEAICEDLAVRLQSLFSALAKRI